VRPDSVDRLTEATSRNGGDPSEILQYRQDVESARTKLVAGHVVAGAAAVALGFSIYQFHRRALLSSSRRDLGASVVVLPTGGAFAMRGEF
jgi:hypothetical protein